MALNAKQILAADDRPIVEVHVPEWASGGDDVVCLRAMDGVELYRYHTRFSEVTEKTPEDIMARQVAACACDVAGERLFTEKQVAKLARKNGAPLRRLFDESQKLMLLDTEGSADFPEPSAPVGDGASGSDSPSIPATDTPKP